MNTLAVVIVVLAGIWLIGLGAVAIAKPDLVKQFFDKFASSAFTHFLEMFVRIIAGTAFVIYSPQMRFSLVFTVFGWLLILSSVVLSFVPWKLHRRFADRSLPLLTKRMILFALVSLFGGAVILVSLILGPDSR
ncbi:MAG: hypothetical protein ABL999_00500 [Pyrinomonadaceae bacterium]